MGPFRHIMALACIAGIITMQPVRAQVIINEIDSDTPGIDAAEFVELYDGGGGSTSLAGTVVVFFNGSSDLSYFAVDLDGFSTDAEGYFVLCGDAANVPNCDLEQGTGTTNWLQNGADAVAFYTGDAADFPDDTPVTTSNLLDAIVYDTDDLDDAGLLVLLNAAEPQVDEDANDKRETESVQRVPNGSGGARNTSTYLTRPPTPGTAAAANTQVFFDVDESSVSEGDAGTTDVDIVVGIFNEDATNATTVDVVVTGGDATGGGVDYTYIFSSPSVSFPAGSTTNQTVTVSIVGETDDEPVEEIVFELQNAGGGDNAGIAEPSTHTLSILNDDAPPPSSVVINEIDADQTGTDNAEFVELYDGGAGSTALDGMVVVFFNGSTDLSYNAFDLDGFSTDANGFFVLCGDAANVTNCDSENGPGTTNWLQNGADAVALYTGNAVDFPDNTPVTLTDLLDALVYDTNDADDAGLLGGLGQSVQYNEDENLLKDTQSIQRSPDGAATYVVALPTPGVTNLPVELVSFDAVLNGDVVSLRWATASEEYNLGYEVQEKVSGFFEPLSFVAAAAREGGGASYTYTVENRRYGQRVFRLKQIDADGSFAYSPEVTVNVASTGDLDVAAIYPNPARDRAVAMLSLADKADVGAEVFDILGRRVWSKTIESPPESGVTLEIETKSLPSGLYVLRINDGRRSAVRQFVVAR